MTITRKILIVIAALSLVAALATTIIWAIDIKPRFQEADDLYQDYQFEHIGIVQIDKLTYQLEIDLGAFANSNYDDLKFYISRLSDDLNASTEIEATYQASQAIYLVDRVEIPVRGDYFLTATFYENNEPQRAVLPITFPIMNPKIYQYNQNNYIMFEFDPNTSWSSFVDREGISVYRSSNYIFDHQAQLLQSNIVLTDSEYVDPMQTEQPYYFLELQSKAGRVTYLSSALFTSITQESFEARFFTDLSGRNYLELKGTVHGPVSTEATRNIQLRVGNYPDTFMVQNSSDSNNSKDYRFVIDVALIDTSGHNDLTLFFEENGALLEATLNSLGVDLESITLQAGNHVYRLINPNGVQVHLSYILTYENLSASFIVEEDTVYLLVQGAIYLDNKANSTHYLYVGGLGSFASTENDAGEFTFKIDLTNLEVSDVWQDLNITIYEDGNQYTIPLPADLFTTTPMAYGERIYQFQVWENQLKLHKVYA